MPKTVTQWNGLDYVVQGYIVNFNTEKYCELCLLLLKSNTLTTAENWVGIEKQLFKITLI